MKEPKGTPNEIPLNARFVIGASIANGFTTFSDGDLFLFRGQFCRLCSGQYGWTLRYTKSRTDETADYSKPPVSGWIDIPDAATLRQMLNDAEAKEVERLRDWQDIAQGYKDGSSQ